MVLHLLNFISRDGKNCCPYGGKAPWYLETMSTLSGILCTLLRRYVETDFPKIDFAKACESVGCECGGGTFSAAHRVERRTWAALAGHVAALTGKPPVQFYEEFGRAVPAILRSSYPTTFRKLLTVGEFVQTATALDYSVLFPLLNSEAAAHLWNTREQGRETVFGPVPDSVSAAYLRGIVEGIAILLGEPVSVRTTGMEPDIRLMFVTGGSLGSPDPLKAARLS